MSLTCLDPIIDGSSRLLILGSMPGQRSLCKVQYYAHPQNAFWPIMGDVLGFDSSLPYEQRTSALLRGGAALFDVLKHCEREGSLDSNIKNPIPNDIGALVMAYPLIEKILLNGGAAHRLFCRHIVLPRNVSVIKMPSTSPANASMTREIKLKAWREAMEG